MHPFNNIDLQIPTSPSECLIAIALPTSQEEFYNAQKGGAYQDFVKGIKGKKPEDIWKEKYIGIAKKLNEVMMLAEQSEMTVLPRFKLADLRGLNSYTVVTIFAHWRDHKIKSHDIINVPLLIDKILNSNDSVGYLLKEIINTENTTHSSETLSKLLTKAVESGVFLGFNEKRDESIPVFNRIELSYRSREILDQWCPDCIVPGNKLELYDGLHSINLIEENISKKFRGIIDFAVCDSALLYKKIKNSNRRVIVNGNKVHLQYRLIIQKAIIQGLKECNANYAVLLNMLEKKIVKNWYSKKRKGIFLKILDFILNKQEN